MEDSKWTLDGEKHTFFLTFANPETEEAYASLRSNKVIAYFPRLLMVVLCLVMTLRRTQLLIDASLGSQKVSLPIELRLFCITIGAITLELLTHCCKTLFRFRCIFVSLLFFYTAADASLTYYRNRINDEPVYAFSSFQIAGTTPVLCSLLCYSWTSPTLAHIVGQFFIIGYAFTVYDLDSGTKAYMIGFIIVISVSYAFYFYSYEYAIRCGALQYARKKRETENWKEMMDKLPQAILINQEGKIVYTNISANKAFDINPNLSPEERTQKAMEELTKISSNEKSLWEFFEKGVSENEMISRCFEYKDNKGNDKKLNAEIWVTNFDGKKSLACTIEDLTVSLELERQMINKKFQRIFMASFTHEIINPVNGILATMDLIQSAKTMQEVKELVETAKTACKHLLYLTNDVVDIAEEERGSKINSSEGWFELNEVIKECEQLFTFGFHRKQLLLSFVINCETPSTIFADRLRYRQILVHLLGNALKYTMEGSVTVKVMYDSTQNMLVTHVTDTGIGISSEAIENLFKLFGEIDRRCDLNPQGIGLSLTICKKYAQVLGGSITVESKKDLGTCFTLLMPVKVKPLMESAASTNRYNTENVEEEVVSQQPYMFLEDPSDVIGGKSISFSLGSSRNREQNKLLVVDDNELNRFALKKLLKNIGLEADEAVNGKRGVEMTLEEEKETGGVNRYAAILMDINMPVMDGIEATKRLKMLMKYKRIEYTPIIAVTAAQCRTEEEKQEYIKAGFDEFVEKPITLMKLREVLQKFGIINK